jgi:Zn-dependent peptidase ImmA (M78 family)
MKTTDQEQDEEANYFAMCLLMPREMVRAELDAHGPLDMHDDKSIANLARKFGVSVPIFCLRLQQLKLEKL